MNKHTQCQPRLQNICPTSKQVSQTISKLPHTAELLNPEGIAGLVAIKKNQHTLAAPVTAPLAACHAAASVSSWSILPCALFDGILNTLLIDWWQTVRVQPNFCLVSCSGRLFWCSGLGSGFEGEDCEGNDYVRMEWVPRPDLPFPLKVCHISISECMMDLSVLLHSRRMQKLHDSTEGPGNDVYPS